MTHPQRTNENCVYCGILHHPARCKAEADIAELEAERDSLRRDWSELSRVALDNRLEADSLRAESKGRLKVLTEKAEEARKEWIRAENAEAELLKAGEALSKFVCKDGESCAFAPLHHGHLSDCGLGQEALDQPILKKLLSEGDEP